MTRKFLSITAFLTLGIAAFASAASQEVTPIALQRTQAAASQNFTGEAFVTSVLQPHPESNVYAAYVTFAPGARTNWHIHPSAQTLIVTSSVGYTQEWGKEVVTLHPGDVVYCPPGVKHWHGASADQTMTHLAISQRTDRSVTWLEPVNPADYPSKN